MSKWEKVESEEGTYFFNSETGQTSWTNPKEEKKQVSLHELVSLEGYVDDAAIENALLKGSSDANAKNSQGESPIHIACRSGYTSAMYYLLLHGAKIDAKTSDGRTVLHCCVYAKEWSLEGLKYLESSYQVTNQIDVNHRDRAGRTALHHAAIQGDENVCAWLVQKGANPTMRDAGLMTASDLASRSNLKSLANMLKSHEEKFSVRHKFGHLKVKTNSATTSGGLKAKSHSPRGNKRRGPQIKLTPQASSRNRSDGVLEMMKRECETLKKSLESSRLEIESLRQERDRAKNVSKQLRDSMSQLVEESQEFQKRAKESELKARQAESIVNELRIELEQERKIRITESQNRNRWAKRIDMERERLRSLKRRLRVRGGGGGVDQVDDVRGNKEDYDDDDDESGGKDNVQNSIAHDVSHLISDDDEDDDDDDGDDEEKKVESTTQQQTQQQQQQRNSPPTSPEQIRKVWNRFFENSVRAAPHIEKRRNENNTTLIRSVRSAVSNHDLSKLESLLLAGAPAVVALSEACKHDYRDAVALILDLDSNAMDVMWKDRCALHVAASQGSIECTKLLLESGVDVSLKSRDVGSTALHFATAKAHVKIVSMLVAYGAKSNAVNDAGLTPMQVGAIEARRLVKATGRTPLEVASTAATDDGEIAMTPSTGAAVSQLRRMEKIQRILNSTSESSSEEEEEIEEKEEEVEEEKEEIEEKESYFGWGMKRLVKGFADLNATLDDDDDDDENTAPRSTSPPPPPPPKHVLKNNTTTKNIVRDKSPERRYVDVMSQLNSKSQSS